MIIAVGQAPTQAAADTMVGAMDDLELLNAWRAGDAAAGRGLFQRYFPQLYRFFANKVDDPDELVQQTFLAIVKARSQFEGRSSFRTYLFTVARHELSPGVFVDVYNLHMDAGGSPEDLAAREAQTAQLLAAIAARSEGMALVVAGDTNMGASSEAILQTLLDGAGLRDACRELDCGDETRIDRIMLRDSDDVVLTPGAQPSATYTLLNAGDHGTGSQFTRVTLGALSLSGAAPEHLGITFIKAWGYCDQQPQGITSVRNTLIAGVDMTGMATDTTSFGAIELGCYLAFEEAAGFLVLNNTFADVTASSVTFATLNLSTPAPSRILGNLVGPHTASTVIGLTSSQAATVDYSNFYAVTTPVDGAAVLGSHMLSVDPGFAGAGDYHLAQGSPGIDSGDPSLTDRDGTRSDMGAYGGPLAP